MSGRENGMTTKQGTRTSARRQQRSTFWQGLILALALGGYVLLIGLLGRTDAAKQASSTPMSIKPTRWEAQPTSGFALPPLRTPTLRPLVATPVALTTTSWPRQGGKEAVVSGERPGTALSPIRESAAPLPTLPPVQWQPLPTVAPLPPMPTVQPVPIVRSRGS